MSSLRVRRVKINKTEQLDKLAHECGELYTQALVFFWRTVRHKGVFLKEKHLKRLFISRALHAHTSDACVEAFTASLKSWRKRRKDDPDSKPPHKRKWYFRIEYKRSAMSLSDGCLRLSNGKGNAPLLLPWNWELPRTVVIRWTGTEYEAIATYAEPPLYGPFPPGKVAGVDLGEVHMAVSHDGNDTHILNGRLLRSKVQQAGVRTLVIGDVRAIRQGNDVGHANNQKLHQWSHGRVRFLLTYKAEHLGMEVVLQEESYA